MLGQSPDVARLIPGYAPHEIRRQSVLLCISSESSGPVASDAAELCAGPELALRGAIERGVSVTQNSCCIAAIEHDKPNAIETDQPVHGGDPKIALRRLAHAA